MPEAQWTRARNETWECSESPITICATCLQRAASNPGVDIPTVSRWLGHKDGGALAMKVYGHLRGPALGEHGAAGDLRGLTDPSNVIALTEQQANRGLAQNSKASGNGSGKF